MRGEGNGNRGEKGYELNLAHLLPWLGTSNSITKARFFESLGFSQAKIGKGIEG